MSRTSIFLSNNTIEPMTVDSVDGKISEEGTLAPPGQITMIASIGDPGNFETATTGQIWISAAKAILRVEIRKPKGENAECIGSTTYDYTLSTTNDYPDSGSVYSRSITLHIS